MKKKLLYLSILILGIVLIPNSISALGTTGATAAGAAAGAAGATCENNAGQIGLQHLNQMNDVGRYWNITIGVGKDRARVYCMDEGKKARTGEICVRQREASPEEVREIIKIVENPEALEGIPVKAVDNMLISTGQGAPAEAAARMAMASEGVSVYNANIVSNELKATKMSSSGVTWDVYVCNGDGTGENWQRMLVPNTFSGCVEPDQPEVAACPGGDMSISGEIGECKPGKGGNEFYFTYAATGGGLHNVHQDYGFDLEAPVGKYCHVYCTEEGWALMPGATGEVLQVGSYMVWPTSKDNYTIDKYQANYYPLEFKGTLTCELEIMTDLETNHANQPVGCHTDVVQTYIQAYKVAEKLWYQPEHYFIKSGLNWELVRQEKIGRTEDPYTSCKANYSSGGASCSEWGGVKPFLFIGHEGQYKGCLDTLETGLAKEEKYLAELVKTYNSFKCSESETHEVCTPSSDPYGEPSCHTELTACAKGKQAAKAAMKAQEALVNQLKAEINAIKGSINTCKSYVEAFEKDARIQHQMHICSIWSISADDYNFSSDASMKYSDYTQEKKDKDLKWYSTGDVERVTKIAGEVNVKNGGTRFDPDIPDDDVSDFHNLIPGPTFESMTRAMKDRQYSVTKADYYKLQTSYHYLDKDKLQYTTSKPTGNYIQIKTKKGNGEENTESGIIPTSYDNKDGEKYDLKIYDVIFGEAGFGWGDGDYICKQEFTKINDLCICPENTDNAGKSVECQLNGMTCPDALAKYCNDPTFEEEQCDLYCKNDPTMPLAPCLNAGLTYEQCNTSDYCNPYECPNTAGVDDQEGMNARLRNCVITQMAQGVSKTRAIEMCEETVCTIGGGRIIYRVIKLENPFPSYDDDETVEQTKLKIGMFNNDIKGRYPGANWNSEKLVKEKIRNNRGANGTEIYNTREPLYTFILNGATINTIRNYNDGIEAGYNDFELECKKNKAAACVSPFVHGKSTAGYIGLVGGTCMNATSKDDFYTCVNNENKTS